jgi:conjugal transfer pilus assembly protein TraW
MVMVKTVLQRSVLQFCRIKFFQLNRLGLVFKVFVFCNTATLLHCNTVAARDLGTHGVIFAIEEVDPLQIIQQKLKAMEESGELERRNLELQKKARASVERPKPVLGITKAAKNRILYYDPTYEVRQDLYDHQGRLFAKKGTRINPLETVQLSHSLIFFDGDDEEQISLAIEKLQQNSVKLILIKGSPLTLAEKLKIPVYFEQNGVLSRKLGIEHVPAFITQAGNQLRIEEIEMKKEGVSPLQQKKGFIK